MIITGYTLIMQHPTPRYVYVYMYVCVNRQNVQAECFWKESEIDRGVIVTTIFFFLNAYLGSHPGANVARGSHSRPSQTVADGAGRLGIEKFVDAADGFLCSSCCCFCDSDLFISPASLAPHPWSSKLAWASRPLDPDTRSTVGDGVIGSGDL